MDTALKLNNKKHCITFSWRLFLSVIALFIAFALCFIAYQYQREKCWTCSCRTTTNACTWSCTT